MRKFVYTALLALSAGVMSCDDFLDTTPTDFVSPANYFKTESDINTALTGVYDILGKAYSRTIWFELDVADQFFDFRSYANIDLSFHNFDASDPKLSALWSNLYQGIDRANVVLANIDKADMDPAKKEVARGEAKFLRAYYYFLLVNYWGDVPLRLEPTKSVNDVNVPRTPAAQIYSFLVKEMEEAEALVNPISAYAYNSRVTKSAVQGILARVYLKMAGAPLNDKSKYADALKWALKVKASGFHSLNPSYAQIFINHSKDIYDKQESIWEVEFNKAGNLTFEEGNLGATNGISSTSLDIGYSYAVVNVLEKQFSLYQPAVLRDSLSTTGAPVGTLKISTSPDTRRDWNISPWYYQTTAPGGKRSYTSTQIYNRKNAKWRREYEVALPKAQNTTPANFPVLRYADVLLMIAEAENELNGPASAFEPLNQVRRRAFGKLLPGATNPNEYDVTGLDKDDFRIAVQEERSRELFSEGLRKFDLIRWGEYLVVMNDLKSRITQTAPADYAYAAKAALNTTERHLLLPIPLAETTLNSAITRNNPGW
jgi:starch-binding outer membrane protein, SusD/RagB family